MDIVRYFYHFENTTENEKISNTSKKIQELYNRAGIPTIHFESIRSKVKRLISSVKLVVETRKIKGASQIKKETLLLQKLTELFEVVRNESVLSNDKKDFLTDQRTIRQRFIIFNSSDPNQQSVPDQILNNMDDTVEAVISSSESLHEPLCASMENLDFDNTPDFVLENEERGKRKIKLCDDDINELSKCGGSYRVIEKALSIGIKTAGGDPNEYALSKSALCKQMTSLRSHNKSNLLEQITSNGEKAIIHFDGKKFAKINEKHLGNDSRMVAVCHTQSKTLPLGLPILQGATARDYVNEIIGMCENFNLIDRVIGLVCDTVVTNTGEFGGVCALYEAETQLEVLWITCRHHIYEVLLSAAFKTSLGAIEAPQIIIFDQLKAEWPNIKENGYQYTPCEQSVLNSIHLRSLYQQAKTALIGHARSEFVRDDYAELNDLCLKFFGIKTKKSFMVPGAMSKSRWMAKGIYVMKTYLFRKELELDENFEKNLLELALFVSIVYCKYWNRCTNATNAPVNDLALISELEQFSNYNKEIAKSVFSAFQNHFWYLGEELAVLALFSDRVSHADKNIMRLKLTLTDYPARSRNSLRFKECVKGMQITDFITDRSLFLLSLLDLDLSFMQQEAETWNRNANYQKAEKLINELILVVNDPAERALGRANVLIQNQKARSESRFQNMFLSLYS